MLRELAKQLFAAAGLPWLTGYRWYRRIQSVSRMPEVSASDVDKKVMVLRDLANRNAYGRSIVWRELARLERVRGNPFIAVVYSLRAMRLAGSDRGNQLGWVVDSLRTWGYHREAEVAEAMYGSQSPAESKSRCAELLQRSRAEHRSPPPPDFVNVDDRRGDSRCRVAVVVSLYNAADKLNLFLDEILKQSLFHRREVELVMIDSASPSDEYGVLRSHPVYSTHPIVYARSHRRETIQMAWNRGVSLSRAPYLTMLGVDEGTNQETSLEILADYLDTHPQVDWVQADCRWTEVDAKGRWQRDLLVNDRSGYLSGCEYVEQGYLSFVGAMMRRSLHDRCGYYDGSFRGGGDNEFKSRVRPFIEVQMLPQTLGLYRNYPDPRVTDHPRADLEDLRAWHLYRTAAGIDYSWSPRSATEARSVGEFALRFRTPYDPVPSTDVEYAALVSAFLSARAEDCESLIDASDLLASMRLLDDPASGQSASGLRAIRRSLRQLQTSQQRHHSSNRLWKFDYFRDVRFHHNRTVWQGDPKDIRASLP